MQAKIVTYLIVSVFCIFGLMWDIEATTFCVTGFAEAYEDFYIYYHEHHDWDQRVDPYEE